jgi:hypothetical protein
MQQMDLPSDVLFAACHRGAHRNRLVGCKAVASFGLLMPMTAGSLLPQAYREDLPFNSRPWLLAGWLNLFGATGFQFSTNCC